MYVGDKNRRFSIRMLMHLFSNKTTMSISMKESSSDCREAGDNNCFAVLDSANSSYKVKINETSHIIWDGHYLIKKLQHFSI